VKIVLTALRALSFAGIIFRYQLREVGPLLTRHRCFGRGHHGSYSHVIKCAGVHLPNGHRSCSGAGVVKGIRSDSTRTLPSTLIGWFFAAVPCRLHGHSFFRRPLTIYWFKVHKRGQLSRSENLCAG
jgi:hypothetical protein